MLTKWDQKKWTNSENTQKEVTDTVFFSTAFSPDDHLFLSWSCKFSQRFIQ